MVYIVHQSPLGIESTELGKLASSISFTTGSKYLAPERFDSIEGSVVNRWHAKPTMFSKLCKYRRSDGAVSRARSKHKQPSTCVCIRRAWALHTCMQTPTTCMSTVHTDVTAGESIDCYCCIFDESPFDCNEQRAAHTPKLCT